MSMKKGKGKPVKVKKASSTARRGAAKSKRTAPTKRPTRAAKRLGGKKRATGKLRRTEAGPVWIGNTAKPVNLSSDDRGSNKATGDSPRVVLL